MPLLDTDHCVVWLQKSHQAHSAVSSHINVIPQGELHVCLFPDMELAEGPWHSQTAQGFHSAQSTLNAFLGQIPLVGITHLTIEEFGRLRALLRQQNQLIGDLDLAIAATAITNGMPLVTHNTNHFARVPGLLLEDWYP